jgi:ketosteroid isomerase-like protein
VLPTLSTRPGNEQGDQMFRSWRTLWRMVWQMHPEHPNATAYRATADAFRSGDREALANLIDADVVWHVPLFGDVRGRDRLVEWLGELVTHGFWLTEHDVFGNDEHLCALSVMGVKRPETDIQTRVVSVFHFREGKQLERWLYPEELEAWKQILPS